MDIGLANAFARLSVQNFAQLTSTRDRTRSSAHVQRTLTVRRSLELRTKRKKLRYETPNTAHSTSVHVSVPAYASSYIIHTIHVVRCDLCSEFFCVVRARTIPCVAAEWQPVTPTQHWLQPKCNGRPTHQMWIINVDYSLGKDSLRTHNSKM